MKILLKILLLIIIPVGSVACNKTGETEDVMNSRVKVIIDADLDSDIDDVGALMMMLNLHKAEVIDLIGVIITSDDPYAPLCASAINSFNGMSEIPIGFLKNQNKLTNHSRYTKQISEEFDPKLNSWQDAEDAISLYRRLLTNNPDESVVIVTIGHLSSLEKLLQSKSDPISTLNGQELVDRKVSKWICMGGQFPHGKEANFYRPDPQSTVYCVNNWKKEVVFFGWEVGSEVITGSTWLKNILNQKHPLYRGYELYNNFSGRPSWDQLAVLFLTEQSKEFFSYTNGYCVVNPDGSNTWQNNISGNHSYAVLNPAIDVNYIGRYIDYLMVGNGILIEETSANSEKQNKVKLIFDTDMLTDCDDAAAMAIMHKLADLGEVDILATMVSSKYPMSAPVVDVINTYYGRPDIPVGAPKNGTGAYRPNSVFLDKVASEFKHQLKSNNDAPDAVDLYRKILDSEPDNSVVIATVGYMSNIETLLKSGPDQFSTLSGIELVKKKVRVWICMGGNFPIDPAIDNVNFTRDASAAIFAINNWPGQLIFAGREIGHNIFIGDKLKGTPPSNPVRRAYELHRERATSGNWNHHTADPCAVMLAIRGLADYWDIEKDGFIDLKDDCSFEWKKELGAKQGYIIQKMEREKLGSIMEELLVAPPKTMF